MYVVTNRRIDENASGLAVFGSVPNAKGPNELRLVNVTRSGTRYRAEVLGDELAKSEVKKLADEFQLDIDVNETWYASLAASCDLVKQARANNKALLFFVHGYNNDMRDIMRTGHELERLYNAIVVPFSWPADGGGAITGTVNYLNDKRDARASAEAFARFVGKVHHYHAIHTASRQRRAMAKAVEKHPDNMAERQAFFTGLLERECTATLNLICHSMGAYVLKHALRPGESAARRLVFDNVALVSADANNEGHKEWVGHLQARNRIFITINENDNALAWSRRKPGQEQRARLGHHLRNLSAVGAHYLNLTPASWVKDEHSYYKGTPVAKNKKLRDMFKAIFCGGRAEEAMDYRSDINAYELK